MAGTSHTVQPTWPTDLGVTVTENTAVPKIIWEMDGNSGDEYSRTAPMKIRVQELHSGRGLLRCILRAAGIPDQMAEDKALTAYTSTATDAVTLLTLISAIAFQSVTWFSTYTPVSTTYDSQDSIISTFTPRDYFSIGLNDNRWAKIKELLDYTRCKPRIGNEGYLHILVPTASGKTWVTGTTYVLLDYVQPVTPNNNFTYRCTTAGIAGAAEPAWPTVAGGTVTDGSAVWTAVGFDYEYKFNVTGDHRFFNKTVRHRFVEPNKEIVSSFPSQEAPQYSGYATSAASFALDKKTRTAYMRLASNAQAASIAAAKIERNELDAERGFATVPMNVGQELWDYVKVTDSRQGDTRIGNVQYIQRNVKIPEGNEALTFSMALSFGKVSMQSIMANQSSAEDKTIEARLTNEQIIAMINDLGIDVYVDFNDLIVKHNSLVDRFNKLIDEGKVNKWEVVQELKIPVYESQE